MSLPRPVVLSGTIGAIVAIGLIAATVFVLPGIGDLTRITTTTQITTITNTNSSSSKLGPRGTLSTLLTDPPTVPAGTTNVYMNYSSIDIHQAGSGNSSQAWGIIGGPGVIDLMQTVNISQTIGLAFVAAGTSFDEISFNVSSVVVTFNKINYTTNLVSNDSRVLDAIPGGLIVGAAQTQAVLIDMSPKVLLLGSSSSSNASFAFLPSAKAFVIPTTDIPSEARVLGGRSNLGQNLWWRRLALTTHFDINSPILLPNFLQINVTNTGNTSVTFKLVTVTPSENSTYGPSVPPLGSSAVFSVTANASLVPLSGSDKSDILEELSSDGYVLSPHATVTFTFAGTIQIGLIQFGSENITLSGISTAQQYIIRVFGNDNVAITDIAA